MKLTFEADTWAEIWGQMESLVKVNTSTEHTEEPAPIAELRQPVDAPAPTVPTPAPVTAGNTAEFDVAGHPWDERIHSQARTKTKKGHWRLQRGVDKDLVAQIQGLSTPAPDSVKPAQPAAVPATPELAIPAALQQSQPVAVPTAAEEPAPMPITFDMCVAKMTEALGNGKIAEADAAPGAAFWSDLPVDEFNSINGNQAAMEALCAKIDAL